MRCSDREGYGCLRGHGCDRLADRRRRCCEWPAARVARRTCGRARIALRTPRPNLCTDNGAMIAVLGAEIVAAAEPTALDIGADSSLPSTGSSSDCQRDQVTARPDRRCAPRSNVGKRSQSLAAASRMRELYGPKLAAAALTQATLRRQARTRFGEAALAMFFTRAGLEQASRPEVADHHANRFLQAGVRRIIDIGCGTARTPWPSRARGSRFSR